MPELILFLIKNIYFTLKKIYATKSLCLQRPPRLTEMSCKQPISEPVQYSIILKALHKE
jgi:hypothetical protein